MHLMPNSWHYISGQFSIQAPRKPQKSAISLPQAPPKLLNLSFTAGQKMSIHTASGGSVATPMMLNGTTKAVTAIVECNEALMAQQQQRQPFGAPKNYSQQRAPFTPAGPERGA